MLDRRKLRLVAVALPFVLCLAAVSSASEPPAETDALPAVLEAAREVVDAARYAALITLDGEGAPQARTMDPFPPELDWTVWLATDRGTRKVEQLRGDPSATLYYWDPKGVAYVTLIGEATLVEDRDAKDRFWKEEWKDFYDGGNRGESYLLIRFEPERLEMVSVRHSIAAEPDSWQPAVFEFDPAAP